MNELSRGNGDGGGFGWPRQVLQPIGPFYEPITTESSLGILPPQDVSGSFELNAGMLCLVERSTFKGNPFECPLEHLDRFERLCRLFRTNGVPEDVVRMTLFPFSLEDKGACWERTISSNLVSTWGNVKAEFLRRFLPKQKTAKLRSDIQNFMQMEDESLSDAWERLKWYTRRCPHHGVSKGDLLWIFYQGVFAEIREALDAASYGGFASLDIEQAEYLIDTLAQDDAYYEDDYPPRSSHFPPQEATPRQPQDLDISTMSQIIMESEEQEQQEMNEELQMEVPLEIALVDDNGKHESLSEDTNEFERMLDEDEEMAVEEPSKQEVTELPNDEANTREVLKRSALDESQRELTAPTLELKPLPKGLRYVSLETNSSIPVIINAALGDDEVNMLLVELRKYRKTIVYSLDDIQGTSQSLCMLDASTRKDHFPLPFIDKILEHLGTHAFYCFLDGYWGFLQFPTHPNNQEKTTSTHSYGTFDYRRMPFELCNTPATFQRCTTFFFSDFIKGVVEVLMDDFSIHCFSFGVGLTNLCRILWWLSLLLLALLLQSKLKLFPGLLKST